jgi:hypothetical protein
MMVGLDWKLVILDAPPVTLFHRGLRQPCAHQLPVAIQAGAREQLRWFENRVI